MDIRLIRLINLRTLVDEYGVEQLANLADSSEKTLQQLLAGTPLDSGNPRSVGHALARRLEAATQRDPGWMDVFHDTDLPVEVGKLIERIRSAAATGKLRAEEAHALYEVVRAMEGWQD